MSYRFADSLWAGSGWNSVLILLASCMTYTVLCVQWKTPDDGQRNCLKHVEFYFKNKFDKLVHLVDFIIRIYHDARSPEHQKIPKSQRKILSPSSETSCELVVLISSATQCHIPQDHILMQFYMIKLIAWSYKLNELEQYKCWLSLNTTHQQLWHLCWWPFT